MVKSNNQRSKRFIIRRLDKVTGIRQTIIVYGDNGKLHCVTKNEVKNR